MAKLKSMTSGMSEATVGTALIVFNALANRSRLLIVSSLLDGERSVGELADSVGLRPSTASQHLTLLRKDKIIQGRRDGQIIRYRLVDPLAEDMVRLLSKEADAIHSPVI